MEKQKSLQDALDHLDNGDWDAAHKIVQSDESPTGCWIHGIVHVMEGDLGDVVTALQVARGAEQLADLESASQGA